MKFLISIIFIVLFAPLARAGDFASSVDLSPLTTLSVQDQQTLKTLDSYARQTLSTITGRSTLDGKSSLFTVLDMSFRPEAYRDRNIIKILNVPLREDFRLLESISDAEKER